MLTWVKQFGRSRIEVHDLYSLLISGVGFQFSKRHW